jgi:hypothetical protein
MFKGGKFGKEGKERRSDLCLRKEEIMNHPHPNLPLYESQTINMGRGQ